MFAAFYPECYCFKLLIFHTSLMNKVITINYVILKCTTHMAIYAVAMLPAPRELPPPGSAKTYVCCPDCPFALFT